MMSDVVCREDNLLEQFLQWLISLEAVKANDNHDKWYQRSKCFEITHNCRTVVSNFFGKVHLITV